jgi:phosphohistidine phosphatase
MRRDVTLPRSSPYNIPQIRSGTVQMRRLLLLRHAKTERESPSGQDRDRRLDSRGREDAPVIGRYLSDENLVPDLALVSPATRTRETFDLLAASLEPPPAMEIVPGLYGADASELLQIIRTAGQADGRPAKSMLVVAHNPGLHELSLTLIGKAKAHDRAALEDNLPTSGLAVFRFETDAWDALSFRHGTLERFVSPKLLRLQGESE